MSVYKQYTPPAGGGGLFLKVEDGQTVKLRFATDPYIFNSEFQGSISTKYAWVVFNRDEDKAQILQLPITGYRNLAAIASDDDWGDPTGYDIKLFREGSGKETKYHLTPSPNKEPLTKEQQDAVNEIKLEEKIKNAIPLAEVIGGKEVPPPQPKDSSDNLPPIENYDADDIKIEDLI